jgi:hypothetical protein
MCVWLITPIIIIIKNTYLSNRYFNVIKYTKKMYIYYPKVNLVKLLFIKKLINISKCSSV